MAIRRDPGTEKFVSQAGAGYAAFWIVVIGLRLLFTYGANHWYTHALGQWLLTNRITVAGLTDGLILLAIGMVLARVLHASRGSFAGRRRRPRGCRQRDLTWYTQRTRAEIDPAPRRVPGLTASDSGRLTTERVDAPPPAVSETIPLCDAATPSRNGPWDVRDRPLIDASVLRRTAASPALNDPASS